MGPPKFGAPGNCPICPPLKPALSIVVICTYTNTCMLTTIHNIQAPARA